MLLPGCRFALLVLPCAVLGAIVASADELMSEDEQLSHVGQLSPSTRHVHPAALRGRFAASMVGLQRHEVPFVALQTSDASLLQASHRNVGASGTARVEKSSHSVHRLDRVEERLRVGSCRGLKLKWWIKIKKKCSKSFGRDSKWDRQRLNGKCASAWNSCITGFYAVCCTQPLGPKNLGTFCAKENLTAPVSANGEAPEGDKACEVQAKVEDVRQVVKKIKEAVKMMDDDVVLVVEEPVVQSIAAIDTIAFAAPGPAPMPGHTPAVAPPSGIVGAAPAPAVMGPRPPPPPTPRERGCDKLSELTRMAVERIDAIKLWAHKDGIHSAEGGKHAVSGPQALEEDIDRDIKAVSPNNAEAKDPDLVFSVEKVVTMGDKLHGLLRMGKFCHQGRADDEDEDDDDKDDEEEDIEEDLKKDPADTWEDDKDDKDDEEEDEPVVTKVNETVVISLLEWDSDMRATINTFETSVHPHGHKWWRYRYEYTIVESFVVAMSLLVLYMVMYLLHGVSFNRIHKFHKTGLPQRFHRYGWVYFIFHAASLMIMVSLAYMLYIPWGESNIFNLFATAVHDLVDERANVPYLGYSWLYMVLDVQFQMFGMYILYTLYIAMVSQNYMNALVEWKALSEESDRPAPKNSNTEIYRHMESIMKKRVRNTPEYKELFKDMKLRMKGVEGLEGPQTMSPDWNDFRLHLFLTDGLGKSMEYLVEVSLTTNIFLALSALVVAGLAYHFELAFMYFLPGFVTLGLILFFVLFLVSRYMRMLADTDDHKKSAQFVTVHSFCRAVQILLYCSFFSFSRLLLSNDIFETWPQIYISALVGLAIIMLLLWACAGHVLKQTTCALILPPHITLGDFKQRLEEITKWHIAEKCHECGSEQLAEGKSLSKRWASRKSGEEMQEPVDPESARKWSYRG